MDACYKVRSWKAFHFSKHSKDPQFQTINWINHRRRSLFGTVACPTNVPYHFPLLYLQVDFSSITYWTPVGNECKYHYVTLKTVTKEQHIFTPESPTRGLQSSPPACTAWIIVGRSKAPWPWLWPWIGSRSHQHTQYLTNHLTVASRSTETWPFEFREILTFGEVWTVVIAFILGKSKIGLWQAVVHVPFYHHQPSVLSSTSKWRRS